ncbi:hypothetical protein EDD18DRAFT_1430138 [Armillaria luteobubalina]|uniref:Uncharacterized protein n=1 Tax=Armillaria luteobubalina TaxID=153913 RepID=A0AA39ULU3_9AGAR|nr:hypothetical protein EDD18DRAFT_1430138 [Armillaria luteobubalina]
MEESDSSEDSSLSSRSDGSTTSPVLSTSTLQTAPSPPPKEAILIPVSPILDPPRLFRPIPYIPELPIHLPEQSLEFFQGRKISATVAAEIHLPSPEVNEAEADKEDLNYDADYDEEFYSEEEDEA